MGPLEGWEVRAFGEGRRTQNAGVPNAGSEAELGLECWQEGLPRCGHSAVVWAPMGPYGGPYGPLMGPYGPIWTLMGPPGQVWEDYVNFS